ncbi:MAG: hypothetical protein NWQ09_06775 [Nonlabens sp.]|nr:hypothetical protein [Nonlabens sp.]
MNKNILLVVMVFAFAKANSLQAQTAGLGETITDMTLIIGNYVKPASEASVLQTSAGWSYDAKSLGLGKFSIALNMSAVPFPSSKKTFNVQDSDFLNLDIRDGESADIPTALGGDNRVFFDFEIGGETYEFQAIGGLGTGFFAFPNLQANLGLWKETELALRYGPKIEIERSSYALYGIGAKHNISQHIFKEDRPVELAIIANFSLVDFNVYFDRLPLAASSGAAPIAVLEGYLTDFHTINTGVIASKHYGNWVYNGGLTYNVSWLDYSLIGDEGPFLDLFNRSLEVTSERTYTFMLDAGVAYKFSDIDLYSQLSTDFDFVNLNVGIGYRIN